MSQSHQIIRLPVLPSTKRRTAAPRSSALALVPGGRYHRRQRIQAKPANRFRYAGLVAVLAGGVLLMNALVLFSILRDEAHLSQPSKVGTPLRP